MYAYEQDFSHPILSINQSFLFELDLPNDSPNTAPIFETQFLDWFFIKGNIRTSLFPFSSSLSCAFLSNSQVGFFA